MAIAASKSSPTTPSKRRGVLRDYHTEEQSGLEPLLHLWPSISADSSTSETATVAPDDDQLSSQQKWAVRLDVSVATLARARKKGDLVGYKIGSQWRYSKRQIADYQRRTEKPLRLYGGRPNDNDLLDVS